MPRYTLFLRTSASCLLGGAEIPERVLIGLMKRPMFEIRGLPMVAAAALAGGFAPPLPGDPDLEKMSVAELLDVASWIQSLLRQHMLSAPMPPGQYGAVDGVTRLLRRDRFDGPTNVPLGVRGGGAYFSFHTGSHSYNDQPDVGLQMDTFRTGFYGGATGYVLDVGDIPLPGPVATRAPESFDQRMAAAWAHLWASADSNEKGHDAAYDARARELELRDAAPAVVQHTYLLRAIITGEHDILVAFRSVATDDDGHTIVWRVLRTFGYWRGRTVTAPGPRSGKPPTWLARQTPAALLQTLAAVRRVCAPRLLEVPAKTARRYRAFAKKDGHGICRILPRGVFDAVMPTEGSGAYYSFATQSHDYQSEPDIELQQGSYSSGFAGNDQGFLLDLGEFDLRQVDEEPKNLSDAQRDGWRFLFEAEAGHDDRGDHSVPPEMAAAAERLGLRQSIPAVVGHTYLLRSVTSAHDVLVSFTVVAGDDTGHTLLWRILAWHR